MEEDDPDYEDEDEDENDEEDTIITKGFIQVQYIGIILKRRFY
jgi:hypothetical protein